MYERRSSIHSDAPDDDDLLVNLTTASDEQHERLILQPLDDPRTGINSGTEKESDTAPLIDATGSDPPVSGTLLCANAPARYVIAIWAFFGFFSLYAMRVNLSVAIVAMVRMPIG